MAKVKTIDGLEIEVTPMGSEPGCGHFPWNPTGVDVIGPYGSMRPEEYEHMIAANMKRTYDLHQAADLAPIWETVNAQGERRAAVVAAKTHADQVMDEKRLDNRADKDAMLDQRLTVQSALWGQHLSERMIHADINAAFMSGLVSDFNLARTVAYPIAALRLGDNSLSAKIADVYLGSLKEMNRTIPSQNPQGPVATAEWAPPTVTPAKGSTVTIQYA
jgi:hypothetical protein